MTPELLALTAVILVQLATLAAYAIVGNLELGPKVTLSPRDRIPPLSPLLGRLQRALANGVEALALFTPTILVVTLSGHASPLTAIAAWAYVATRVAYVPAYVFGLVPWRSIIWTFGLVCITVLLAKAILGP